MNREDILDLWESDLRSCRLCEHRCGVDRLSGQVGVCGAGSPVVASRTLHPAPPESYTVFTAGCNFKCIHCQNWSISQWPDNGMPVEGYLEPALLAEAGIQALESPAGKAMGADRLFFSGGEPTIHLPYIERVVAEARKRRLNCRVNFDTNGFLTEQSLERVLAFATSITFDLKAYWDETHRALNGAPAVPVLRNARLVASEAPQKIWEFRIVVIPGINEEDILPLCMYLAEISPELPVCFLAFRPNFLLEDHPGAGRKLLKRCLGWAAQAGLKHVSWAGLADIPGRGSRPDPCSAEAYARSGARTAAGYARSAGCRTHPRDCRTCPSNLNCPLRRYLPSRST